MSLKFYKMRWNLLTLIVLAICAICINGDSEQGVVQGRYNFNHPPWAEDYNPIPVAVVYEDDVMNTKEVLDKKLKVDTKPSFEIGNENTEEKTKPVEITTEVLESVKEEQEKKEEDIQVKSKARALNVFQIPVMVVYDSVSNTSSQQTQTPPIKAVRKKIKQLRRRKLLNKTSTEPLVPATEPIPLKTPTVTTERLVEYQGKRKSGNHENAETIRVQGKRERDPVVPIINSENHVYAHNGNFHYSYEGGDGTKAHSEGQLMRNLDDEAAGEAVSGGFSYTDKDGNDFSLSYTADERGYRPTGAHLPTPPPIPPAIARALAYLATATTPEPVTKPSKT